MSRSTVLLFALSVWLLCNLISCTVDGSHIKRNKAKCNNRPSHGKRHPNREPHLIRRVNKKHAPKEALVTIEEGTLQGNLIEKGDGSKYYSFLGVPYAEHSKRFRSATPASVRSDILNATNSKDPCFYRDIETGNITGSEDCLHLSVYTPTLDPEAKTAVIVAVFGGWYQHGNYPPSHYSPSRLVKKNIVYVSVNYRLGVFGFLNCGIKEAPGNVGIKDIRLALQWIQRNIHTFGGDRTRVTLYGIGSGAQFVDLLTLSPTAEGLVSKVILHGASAAVNFAVRRINLRKIYQLSRRLESITTDVRESIETFRNVSANQLQQTSDDLAAEWSLLTPLTFLGASVEEVIPGEECVFCNDLDVMIDSAQDIPIMFLFTDGMMNSLLIGHNSTEDLFNYANNVLEDIIPWELLRDAKGFNEKSKIVEPVKNFYTNNNRRFSSASPNELLTCFGDSLVLHPTYKMLKSRQKVTKSPIYVGQFSYDNESLFPKKVPGLRGIEHPKELSFVFDTPTLKITKKIDSKTKAVADRFTSMIANFANFGDPTPKISSHLPVKWSALKQDSSFDVLNIGDDLKMTNDPFKKRFQIWNDLYN